MRKLLYFVLDVHGYSTDAPMLVINVMALCAQMFAYPHKYGQEEKNTLRQAWIALNEGGLPD